MKEDPGLLAKRRADRFWRRMLPELKVAGDYLPGFLIAGLAALYLYDRLIDGLSPSPWLTAACALPVAAAVAWVRVRTWLEPADPVFLMPAETALAGYFRRVLFSAWPGQLLAAGATALAVWPLYRVQAAMPFASYAVLTVALLFYKTANMALWWQEQRMAEGRTRRIFALFRWATAFLAVLLGLRHGVFALLAAGGLSAGILAVCGRRVSRFEVNWERLIALEERAASSWRRFLGQMTDWGAVGTDGSSAKNNPLARLAGVLRHAPENAYRYLFLLVWLRSPLFGISLRLVAAGVLIAAISGGAAVRAGIGALFAAALHVQLKELGRGEGEAERAFLLPLTEENRRKAARDVRLSIWLAGTALFAAPAVLSLVI